MLNFLAWILLIIPFYYVGFFTGHRGIFWRKFPFCATNLCWKCAVKEREIVFDSIAGFAERAPFADWKMVWHINILFGRSGEVLWKIWKINYIIYSAKIFKILFFIVALILDPAKIVWTSAVALAKLLSIWPFPVPILLVSQLRQMRYKIFFLSIYKRIKLFKILEKKKWNSLLKYWFLFYYSLFFTC